ncbi:MAG TPA: hypothetical protein VD837_11655, partial [Terriglobales bacterium]|nr:hypothetical protein [Terriglobales bacterium]
MKNPNRYHGRLVRVRATDVVGDEISFLTHGGCRIASSIPFYVNNESVKRYIALVDAKPVPPEPCQACRRYSVTATLVGVVENADPTGKNPGKPGFGHMGMFNVLLKIRSATNIVA